MIMKPYDQAKLLFLCFLRSSAALATSEPPLSKMSPHLSTAASRSATSTSSTSSSTSSSASLPSLDGHICLRVATRMDVPSIQRCNLATLPENYSPNFYVNHMRQWPDLALVAELVPNNNGSSDSTSQQQNNHHNNYNTNSDKRNTRRRPSNPLAPYDPGSVKDESRIVGYVLGKVEESAVSFPRSTVIDNDDDEGKVSFPSFGRQTAPQNNHQYNNNDPYPQPCETEMLGHVTSLAILPPYRRRGLAALLMKQLHHHMESGYDAQGVGLHVRVSNVAARRLYCEGMGYGVVDVIRGYYQDGEDAFFMRKDLNAVGLGEEYGAAEDEKEEEEYFMDGTENSIRSRMLRGVRSWGSKKNNAGSNQAFWENGPMEFRLPRNIPLTDQSPPKSAESVNTNTSSTPSSPSSIEDSEGEQEVQVMTGSL